MSESVPALGRPQALLLHSLLLSQRTPSGRRPSETVEVVAGGGKSPTRERGMRRFLNSATALAGTFVMIDLAPEPK